MSSLRYELPDYLLKLCQENVVCCLDRSVQIYDPDGKLLAAVYTDEDGWYMYNYKHTRKAATFTMKLPDYNKQQSVTLKANSLAVVNFVVP